MDPDSPPMIQPTKPTSLCPGCMAVIDSADFCPNCGMPVSSGSTIDPLKQIYAEGWLFRRAVRERPSRMVLIGMWLLFAPALLFPAVFLFCPPEQGSYAAPSTQFPGVLALPLVFGTSIISAIILYKVTVRYFRPPANVSSSGPQPGPE